MKTRLDNNSFDKDSDFGPIAEVMGNDGITRFFAAVDEFGQPVRRTKMSHPYSYDGFVLWRGGANKEATGTIYSDRLLQWDWDKHNRLCEKHFGNKGQLWDNRDPKLIEAFLRDWCEDPGLKLIFIMEYCNQASGYPCWRFDYRSSK